MTVIYWIHFSLNLIQDFLPYFFANIDLVDLVGENWNILFQKIYISSRLKIPRCNFKFFGMHEKNWSYFQFFKRLFCKLKLTCFGNVAAQWETLFKKIFSIHSNFVVSAFIMQQVSVSYFFTFDHNFFVWATFSFFVSFYEVRHEKS